MLSKITILERLKKVLDPELNINIVDLGLIYDVKIKDGEVEVVMTLTSMGCPLVSVFETEIKRAIRKNKEVKKVKIDLTFDPPWNIDKMSKEARMQLGF